MSTPDWSAALEAAVETVFRHGWGLATERFPQGAVTGVIAVMPLSVGTKSLKAVLILEAPLAARVAECLGAAPAQAHGQSGEATAECLNLLAGRMAGQVASDLTLGVPSLVHGAVMAGVTIATGVWKTPAGALCLSVEAVR